MVRDKITVIVAEQSKRRLEIEVNDAFNGQVQVIDLKEWDNGYACQDSHAFLLHSDLPDATRARLKTEIAMLAPDVPVVAIG